MKRVVVIGLGIFGFNIAKDLYESGFEVIAIDKNKDNIQKIKDFSTKAILADGADKEVIESIGIQPDDVAIIPFGEDLAASTLITLHLKEMKVKTIIVKAPNEDHKHVLEKVGATEVVIPERAMADKVAKAWFPQTSLIISLFLRIIRSVRWRLPPVLWERRSERSTLGANTILR